MTRPSASLDRCVLDGEKHRSGFPSLARPTEPTRGHEYSSGFVPIDWVAAAVREDGHRPTPLLRPERLAFAPALEVRLEHLSLVGRQVLAELLF